MLPEWNLVRMKLDQVWDFIVAQMLVDDPVHELEASEGDREDDTAVLVDVRGRHPEHLVEVLHVALRVRWRRSRRGRRWTRHGRRHRRGLRVVHGRRTLRHRRQGHLLLVAPVGAHVRRDHPAPVDGGPVLAALVVRVAIDGALSAAALAVKLGVMNLEVNCLKTQKRSICRHRWNPLTVYKFCPKSGLL